MTRTYAASPKPTPPVTATEKEFSIAIFDFLEGLYTDKDPKQIPDNALTEATNVEYFRSMLFRRNGLVPWTLDKPDSSQVMGVFPFFEQVTGLNILRFTKNKIYRSKVTGWTEYTPSIIAANSGSISDYFVFVTADNRGFFTNGVDPIREVDPVGEVYKALGNAPRYKYITAAFNRIIGASLVDTPSIPYKFGWCGESNYAEWDPTVDISAGSQLITSSPTSVSDEITGIFSTEQMLIIPREQSIWTATHNSSATSPFSAFATLPHIGADLPRTIRLTDYGLAWVENQSSSVYVWNPAQYPPVTNPDQIDISKKIKRALRAALNDAAEVWGTYSHETRNYSIHISSALSSIVTVFTFNFLTAAWTTVEIGNSPTVTTDIQFSNSTLTINELSGLISGLMGSIDSLGGLRQNTTRVYGYANGDMLTQEPYSGLANEVGNIVTSDNGIAFTSTVALKCFEFPPTDTFINLVRAYVYPYSAGTIQLQMSKDEGSTWTTIKSITFTASTRQKIIQLRRALKSSTFMWRLVTSDCMFAITGLMGMYDPAGISK